MAISAPKFSCLSPEKRRDYEQLFVDQATGSFLILSLGIGLLAALLPIALVGVGGYNGIYSISYFYWSPPATYLSWSPPDDTPRNILVGALWGTGVFLFLFRGLSRQENWLLNIAGFFAIMVAMNPMSDTQSCGKHHTFDLHGACAVVFFLCLTVVAVFFSKERVNYIEDEKLKWRFKRAYDFAGILMIAMPATVLVIHNLSGQDCATHTIYWCETLAIWSFAFYWLIKTLEYRLLLGVRS